MIYMTEAGFIGTCQDCEGTGIQHYKDENGNPLERPCPFCGADGKVEVKQSVDITEITTKEDTIAGKVDMLQISVDKVAEVTKGLSDFVNGKMMDYIVKIYEIISKEK